MPWLLDLHQHHGKMKLLHHEYLQGDVPVVLSDMIRELTARGVTAKRHQVSYAIQNGHVTEPVRNGAGYYEYGPEHVEQMVVYLNTTGSRRGRPKTAAKMGATE